MNFFYSFRVCVAYFLLFFVSLAQGQNRYVSDLLKSAVSQNQDIRQQGDSFTKSVLPLDSSITYSTQNERLKKTAYTYNPNLTLKTKTAYFFSENNQWQIISKIDYRYNNNGNLTAENGFDFDKTKGTFNVLFRSDYQQNETDGVKTESHYYRNEETRLLDGSWQYKRTYDNRGNPVLVILSVWDKAENRWQFYQKFIYAYSDESKQTLAEKYCYQANRGEWIKESKAQLKYDANNNLTLQEYATGCETSNRWKNYSKIESIYRHNKLEHETVFNADEAGNWTKTYRTDFTYLSSGKIKKAIASQFNKTTNSWHKAFKYIYTYDAANNLKTIAHLIKKKTTNSWVDVYKNLYETHTSPLVIKTESYFARPGQKWTGNIKKITSYDDQSRLNGLETYFWNNVTEAWLPASKKIVEYNRNNLLNFVEKYAGNSKTPGIWNGYYKASYDYELQKGDYVVTKKTRYKWDTDSWSENNHSLYFYGPDTITAIKPICSKTKIYWSSDENIHIQSDKAVKMVAVYSIIGKQVYQSVAKAQNIATSSWAKGVYTVTVFFDDNTWKTKKIYLR